MQASSGLYRWRLDQVRAVASYMVFTWHFIHTDQIVPIQEGHPTVWPLALLNLGYVGVSLFMALSGYLFASLTDGQEIQWGAFFRNRAMRLLPLLALVMVLAYGKEAYLGRADGVLGVWAWGWLLPTLPQGAWSLTVECHFYLLLPVILWLGRWDKRTWLGVVAFAMLLRTAVYLQGLSLEPLASATLLGRIDQFMLGMCAWHWRDHLKGRHVQVGVVLLAYSLWLTYLDHLGSPYATNFHRDLWWVGLTTVDGLAAAVAIAWYDVNDRNQLPSAMGRFVARIGQVSYSMYLLHMFWVWVVARWLHGHVLAMSNPEVAMVMATVVFLLSLPVAIASYKWVERPFLALRTPYRTPRVRGGAGVVEQPLADVTRAADAA